MLRSIVFTALIAATACNSPTSPNDQVTAGNPQGRLAGMVTIGPNCPGPETQTPCPAKPEAYAARKILVYNEEKTTLLSTVTIDAQGAYGVDLAPGRFTIDLQRSGIDRTPDLPATVDIRANTVTTVNVNIDTGIR